MKEYAKEFYKSQAWKDCRAAYIHKCGGLCEMCLKQGLYVPGEIVHHKIHLTDKTIKDPAIALSFDNLMYLCRKHHAEVHEQRTKKRYSINPDGSLQINGD